MATPSLYQLLPLAVLLVNVALLPRQKLTALEVMEGAVGVANMVKLPEVLPAIGHPPVKLME